MSDRSTTSTELRAVRSLSYFDRYPERKRSAPPVATSGLVKGRHSVSAAQAFERATEVKQIASDPVPAPSPISNRGVGNARKPASIPASSSIGSQGAMQRYKAHTLAATAARTPSESCSGERAPKKRPSRRDQNYQHQFATQVSYVNDKASVNHSSTPSSSRCASVHNLGPNQERSEGCSQRHNTISSPDHVMSIDDIVRKHSPTTTRHLPLRGEGYGWKAQISPSRPGHNSSSQLPAQKGSDDSDRSSLDSVELELRHTLRISASDQHRTTQASASPALQAIFSGSQKPSSSRQGYLARQQMQPSLSAPVLLQKKSSPTLMTSTRMSDVSSLVHQPDSERSGKSRRRKIKPFLPSIAANVSRSKSAINLKSTASHEPTPKIPQLPTLQPPSIQQPISTRRLSSSRISAHESSIDDSDEANSTSHYLRSARLTTLMTLRRPLYAGSVVSFADVGDVDGHAVFLFMGLGAVRYLAGLYDDMASALGLRLICIDRWGMGKTDDLPADRRGILEWGEVVREVADRLGVVKFSVLAHSAGAPYAMALSLSLGHRLAGPIHLLAPWVSAEIESGYKWLRYVPDGIIRTAQAAEWRVQGWKLGASALSPDSSTSSTKKANITNHTMSDLQRSNHNASTALQSFDSSTTSSMTPGDSICFSPLPSPSTSTGSKLQGDSVYDYQMSVHPSQSSPAHKYLQARHSTCTPVKHAVEADVSGASSYEMMGDFSLIRAWHARSHSDTATIQDDQPPPLPPKTPLENDDIIAAKADTSFASLPSPTASASNVKRQCPNPSPGLPTELLRASHAENSASASDLLVILGRSSQKPWGFSYVDVKHPVLVWHGEEDERVSVSSVLWMERAMDDCKVNIVSNANHSLLLNVDVVVGALESIVANL